MTLTDPAPVQAEAPPSQIPFPFFFIRHGETDWNREGRLQGQTDIPLNPRGRDQAAATGRSLARLMRERGLDAEFLDFVASPLLRTCETMELMRAAMNLPPAVYRLDGRLRELTFGDWEGLTWPEIRHKDPRLCEARRRDKWGCMPPGGESYADLVERLRPWLGSVTENAVVVAHGGVARVLMVMLAGLDRDKALNEEIWQGRVLVFDRGLATWV